MYKQIKGVKKPLSSLVFGTSALESESGFATRFIRKERKRMFDLLDFVYDQGYTTFDTAAVYMLGESEKVLGEWIAINNIRDKVVIITKGSHPNFFILPSIIYGKGRLQKKEIDHDLSLSLKRLKTDYIDIYMPHRDNEKCTINSIMDALNTHVSAGKVITLGCSNWSYKRIDAANQYASYHNLQPFRVASPHYSLFDWTMPPWKGTTSLAGKSNKQAFDWHKKNKLPLLAWSPLAGGVMHSQISKHEGPYGSDRNLIVMNELKKLSATIGISPETLILYWMSKQISPPIFPITKSTNKENIKANALSQSLELSGEILKKITELSRL